jgi:hypothetical protein
MAAARAVADVDMEPLEAFPGVIVNVPKRETEPGLKKVLWVLSETNRPGIIPTIALPLTEFQWLYVPVRNKMFVQLETYIKDIIDATTALLTDKYNREGNKQKAALFETSAWRLNARAVAEVEELTTNRIKALPGLNVPLVFLPEYTGLKGIFEKEDATPLKTLADSTINKAASQEDPLKKDRHYYTAKAIAAFKYSFIPQTYAFGGEQEFELIQDTFILPNNIYHNIEVLIESKFNNSFTADDLDDYHKELRTLFTTDNARDTDGDEELKDARGGDEGQSPQAKDKATLNEDGKQVTDDLRRKYEVYRQKKAQEFVEAYPSALTYESPSSVIRFDTTKTKDPNMTRTSNIMRKPAPKSKSEFLEFLLDDNSPAILSRLNQIRTSGRSDAEQNAKDAAEAQAVVERDVPDEVLGGEYDTDEDEFVS